MATNRIVLLITDDEIDALDEIASVLDQMAEMQEYVEYPEEAQKINNLYKVLNAVRERIGGGVLAS